MFPVNTIDLMFKLAAKQPARNAPDNPGLWSQAISEAKKRFTVYPSAYANGWAAKWYKERGGGWHKEKEAQARFVGAVKNYIHNVSGAGVREAQAGLKSAEEAVRVGEARMDRFFKKMPSHFDPSQSPKGRKLIRARDEVGFDAYKKKIQDRIARFKDSSYYGPHKRLLEARQAVPVAQAAQQDARTGALRRLGIMGG